MVQRLGVLAVSAALMLGLAVPASAEQYQDQTGDVYTHVVNSNDGFRPASGSPDIKSVRATYTKTQFIAEITLTSSAKKGWNELSLQLSEHPEYVIRDIREVGVRAKNGKIVEAGRKSATKIVPGEVTAQIAGNTITVRVDISSWYFRESSVWFYVRIWRENAAKQFWADEYPSRDPSPTAGGALVLGNPKYQLIKRTTGTDTSDFTLTPTLTKTGVVKGKTAKVKIVVKPKSAGNAAIFDGKTKLGVMKVKKSGKATYTLPKSLKVGEHKIAVKFTPKGGTAGKKISAGTLTVKKK